MGYSIQQARDLTGDELKEFLRDFVPEPAGEPTNTLPGSWDRVEVMKQRAEKGQSLWHKEDLKGFGGLYDGTE